MAFYGCVKCPSLQAQCLDCFEHEHSALHFSIVHSGNALLHSKYQAFSAEACGLGTRLMFVCESHMCSPRFHAHLFIYACLFTVQMMPGEKNKNEGSLLVRGKLLKRLEPGTPSWSHFRFHVSSCPSPKWPITIISPLVVVMLAREKGREREGEGESDAEGTESKWDGSSWDKPENNTILTQHRNQTASPMTEGESIICMGNRVI